MSKSLTKDTLRNITKSMGRFISILLIIALGVAFFVGVKSSPLAMKETADVYFDEYNFMDMRLVSTFGFTDDDIKAIQGVEGVEGVFPTYSTDVLTNYQAKELVMRIHGLPLELLNTDDSNYVNRVKVIEGRLPEKSGEAVVERSAYNENITLGSTITLYSGTDTDLSETLTTTEYTVVGFVETPYYLSLDKGSTTIGSGNVDSYIMIPQSDFLMDIYTEVYLTAKNAAPLMTYSADYKTLIESLTPKLEDVGALRADARFDEIKTEATAELEKAKKEFEEQKTKALAELDDAAKQIETAKAELAKGEKELVSGKNTFNSTITDAQNKIKEGEAALAKAEKELNTAYDSFMANKPQAQQQLAAAEAELAKGESELQQLSSAIDQLNAALQNQNLTEAEIAALTAQLTPLQQTYETSKAKLDAGKAELEKQKQALVNGENELKAGLQQIQNQKATLSVQKANLETEKETALAKFKQAEADIETGKAELVKAEESYQTGKTEAEEKFKEAEEEIQDAEAQIKDIEKPEWFVLDREKHYSYVDYKNAAESIEAISKVFPVFFFLVAALVCLTTMTRMVDEQRMTIGTLKALGYGKVKIASKFLIYAGLASILGSVIGTLIGFNVFPRVVLDAYAMMYVLPESVYVFSWPLVLLATFIAVGVTTLSAYFAVNSEIIEAPSVLMRPKAPKEGKRILLERIPFIWNHLSFTGKVTVRNIFRYKKRFLMTVFGIAGCTALLLTGFGIKDSIRTIIDRQFGTIYHYDLSISLDRAITDRQKEKLLTTLSDDERVYDALLVKGETGKLASGDVVKDISLFIPQNTDQFAEFVTLQERQNEKQIELPNDGIVITEKVAKQLNAKVGSEITLENLDGERVSAKVAGIAENYTFHYAYISPSYYEQLFGELPVFDSVLTMINDYHMDMEDSFTKDYKDINGVSGLSWNSTVRQSFDDTISSLNYVVLLMIISAGALAFVVLYNLTNVNISERMREIATIKVLGFYDKEVSAYIYRENIILTIIGTAVGLVLGMILHRYIMLTVEMDMMMFGRNIATLSFVYAAALTIFFSILVNFAMYYKLKNVQMVESLKSVD